jgi:hypothetical protein
MPIETVTIPQEVDKAIKELCAISGAENAVKHLYLTNWDYLKRSVSNKCYRILIDYAEKNPVAYMRALTEGYKVEKSKEELIRDYFELQNKRPFHIQDPAPLAVVNVLKILDIKIEGVNA